MKGSHQSFMALLASSKPVLIHIETWTFVNARVGYLNKHWATRRDRTVLLFEQASSTACCNIIIHRSLPIMPDTCIISSPCGSPLPNPAAFSVQFTLSCHLPFLPFHSYAEPLPSPSSSLSALRHPPFPARRVSPPPPQHHPLRPLPHSSPSANLIGPRARNSPLHHTARDCLSSARYRRG